jgi:hypothetical protein
MPEEQQALQQPATPQALQAAEMNQTQTQNETGGGQGQETPKSAGSLLLEGLDDGDGDKSGDSAAPPAGEKQEQKEQPEGKTPEDQENRALTREDIVVPEGAVYDEEMGQSFLDIINDAGTPRKDMMQKLANLYVDAQKKTLEGLSAANDAQLKADLEKWNDEIKGWQAATKADSEYGGQKWEASKAVIARGCNQLATPEAVKLIAEYRLNAHPEIVRMFYRAGKLAGEDQSPAATGLSSPAPGDGLLNMYRKSLNGV